MLTRALAFVVGPRATLCASASAVERPAGYAHRPTGKSRPPADDNAVPCLEHSGRADDRLPQCSVTMLSLRDIVRSFTHLVDWVDYQVATSSEPSMRPARLSFYSSSAPAAPGKEVA